MTRINRRRALRSITTGAVGSGLLGTVAKGNKSDKVGLRSGSSRLIDIKVTHDVNGDIPVTNNDRFIFPTYRNNSNLYYVAADISQ